MNLKLTHLFLLVYLTGMALNVHAQESTGIVNGKITTSDNQPASSVAITVKGTGKGALTDDIGAFVIKSLKPGDYTLVISLIGHKTIEQVVNIVANETKSIDIQLSTSSKELAEIVVVAPATRFAKKQSDYVARIPITNLENPQVYTVVPKELFQEQLVTDFRSALQSAPGVNNITLGVGSGGVGLGMRMRGFSGSNAAGSIRNGMSTNWVTMSDPVNLESIEVIKGPSGTLFGSSLVTYGGLVNRVTKKPFEILKGEVGLTAGSYGLSRATIDINAPINEDKTFLVRVNAALDNQRTFQDYGKSKTSIIAPAFSYIVNDRFTLDFDFELFSTARNSTFIGLGSPGPKNAVSLEGLGMDFNYSYTSNGLLSEAKTFNAFAKATYKISNEWTSQTQFSYANTDNIANYLFLLVNTDSTIQRRLMYIPSNFGVNQVQQNFIGDFKLAGIRNRLVVGLDYTQMTTTDTRYIVNFYDTVKINKTPATINIDKYQQKVAAMTAPSVINKRNLQTYAAYASDVINVTDNLIAMASVRVESYDSEFDDYKQTAVSPKFGVIYQVIKNKVSVFGNYMNGYTNVAPGTTADNPTGKTSFKPEHANQYEGGVKLELLKGKLNGTLSYYNITVSDKVRPDPNNPTYSVQDGTQESKGFEADLIANPISGLHIIFGYGYNESKYTKAAAAIEGKRPYSTPANVANAWISYKFLHGNIKGLGFGFGGNTQSDSYLNDANTFTVEGYTRYDATVFYEQPKYRFGVKLNNITNEKSWVADFWANQMPTRQLVASIVYRF